MTSLDPAVIQRAVGFLQEGQVIAYPTEAVFGLGCDPFRKSAVDYLLTIKQRPVEKGLLLIASNWEHIKNLVTPIEDQRLDHILSLWPGPYTWVFPASNQVPPWIRGQHNTIALRITAHPVANSLCEAWGGPLVSTSANLNHQPPLRKAEAVSNFFGSQIAYVIPGEVGSLKNPTEIRDAQTGRLIRGN